MKTKPPFVYFVVATLLLAGCSKPAAPDPHLAAMEQRIDTLENRLAIVEKNNVANTVSIQTNRAAFDEHMVAAFLTGDRLDNLVVRVMELSAELHDYKDTNRVVVRTAQTNPSRPAPSTAMRDGVPLAIYNEIRAAAETRWGQKYDMVVFEIKEQIEAYKKLHP